MTNKYSLLLACTLMASVATAAKHDVVSKAPSKASAMPVNNQFVSCALAAVRDSSANPGRVILTKGHSGQPWIVDSQDTHPHQLNSDGLPTIDGASVFIQGSDKYLIFVKNSKADDFTKNGVLILRTGGQDGEVTNFYFRSKGDNVTNPAVAAVERKDMNGRVLVIQSRIEECVFK